MWYDSKQLMFFFWGGETPTTIYKYKDVGAKTRGNQDFKQTIAKSLKGDLAANSDLRENIIVKKTHVTPGLINPRAVSLGAPILAGKVSLFGFV